MEGQRHFINEQDLGMLEVKVGSPKVRGPHFRSEGTIHPLVIATRMLPVITDHGELRQVPRNSVVKRGKGVDVCFLSFS